MSTSNKLAAHITRRSALGLISGATLTSALATSGCTATNSSASAEKNRKLIIRTVLNDIDPKSLGKGSILFHEHLSQRYPTTRAMAERQGIPVPPSYSDDIDLMIEETRAAGKEGVSLIVDGGHRDMDRSIDALKRIATGSGVHVVASGGFYMERNYPPELAAKSANEIADELVRDAHNERWGALGEIGQQSGVLTETEKKVFAAVAKTQVRTGLPIFTHNAYTGARQTNPPVPREAALRQLDVLEANGVDPKHVVIGHVCCLDDPKAEVSIALAKRGVFVGFDRVTIQIVPDAQKVTTIMAMAEAGYVDHVMIASDFYSGRSLKKNGGPGIAQAVTVFGPMLIKAGMKEDTLRRIFVDNAQRFLAYAPV
jgi:phosphotriesterase-related protein